MFAYLVMVKVKAAQSHTALHKALSVYRWQQCPVLGHLILTAFFFFFYFVPTFTLQSVGEL